MPAGTIDAIEQQFDLSNVPAIPFEGNRMAVEVGGGEDPSEVLVQVERAFDLFETLLYRKSFRQLT